MLQWTRRTTESPSSSIKPRLVICQADTMSLPSSAVSGSVRHGHLPVPTANTRLRHYSGVYNPFSFTHSHLHWEVTGQPMDASGGKSSCDTR